MWLLWLAGSLWQNSAALFILRLLVGWSVGLGQSRQSSTYALSRTVYVCALIENRAHGNIGEQGENQTRETLTQYVNAYLFSCKIYIYVYICVYIYIYICTLLCIYLYYLYICILYYVYIHIDEMSAYVMHCAYVSVEAILMIVVCI